MQRSHRKDAGLPPTARSGSVHMEFKRCGKPKCRCNQGLHHGPYFYHYWRERGRLKKRYVPAARLVETLEMVAQQKTNKSNMSAILRELRSFRYDVS